MFADFAAMLDAYMKQAGLPVRRIARQATIPHQTIYNWLAGKRPRWHPALTADLSRLALALRLDEAETDRLLQAAGCLSQRTMISHTKESSMTRTPRLPDGWHAAGSDPEAYEMGLDPGPGPTRGGAAYIKAGERPQGFATLMQTFKSDAYLGKRPRFSAAVRADGIEQWAGLWMRVDGEDAEKVLAFDNMGNRPITGTRDWETHAVVLDVPEESSKVAFGVLLAGPGRVWITDVCVAPVGPDVATTQTCEMLPDHPQNLSFDE